MKLITEYNELQKLIDGDTEVQKRKAELKKVKEKFFEARQSVLNHAFGVDQFENRDKSVTINGYACENINVDQYCNLLCHWKDLPPIDLLPAFIGAILVYYNLSEKSPYAGYRNRSGTQALIRLFEQHHANIDKDYLKTMIIVGDLVPAEGNLPGKTKKNKFRHWLFSDSYASGGNLKRFKDWDYNEFLERQKNG